MVPTPEQVVPLFLPVVPDLRRALRKGIDHADDLQPDPDDREPWYWSHSARWGASRVLRSVGSDEWTMVEKVPNCGIHLRVGGLHVARVLRSLDGTTPHSGSNIKRKAAWVGVQGQLALGEGDLPPLSMILDWHEVDGEPEIHAGLPVGSWTYGTAPRLHWRVPMPEDGADLDSLRFDPGPDTGDAPIVTLTIDPAEEARE